MSTTQERAFTLWAPGPHFNYQVGDRKFTSDAYRLIYNVSHLDTPALQRMGCVVVDRPSVQ